MGRYLKQRRLYTQLASQRVAPVTLFAEKRCVKPRRDTEEVLSLNHSLCRSPGVLRAYYICWKRRENKYFPSFRQSPVRNRHCTITQAKHDSNRIAGQEEKLKCVFNHFGRLSIGDSFCVDDPGGMIVGRMESSIDSALTWKPCRMKNWDVRSWCIPEVGMS